MIKPLFAEMKTTDFADCAEWIAILPISAIEQHGTHLPLETDFAIAKGNIAAIIPHIPHDLPVTFLPILPFGKSDEHGNFKGTLTLSANTMINIIVEIGESLAKSGIKKLIIANSHGGNVSLMDIAALELRKRFNMLIVQLSWHRLGYPEGLFSAHEQKFGIHGGEIETSQMLHLRPNLVDMTKAQNFISRGENMAQENAQLRSGSPIPFAWMAEDLNTHGAIGNAALATREKGAALEAHMVREFVALARDVQRMRL
jgi:creatinine amidohydrolase